jgi:hypothetical protein
MYQIHYRGWRTSARLIATMFIVGMTFAVGSNTKIMAQQGPVVKGHSARSEVQATTPSESLLERQKFDLERQKLADETAAARERERIEWAKLDFERSSAYRSLFSSMVPLLVALGTLFYSIWSFRKQAKLQNEMQAHASQAQFVVKAAEIAFAGKTPVAVGNRAALLQAIFDDWLPKKFASSFDPAKYGGGKKEGPEEKKFFLELLLKYPSQMPEIFELWNVLFGDEWLERVKPFIRVGKDNSFE